VPEAWATYPRLVVLDPSGLTAPTTTLLPVDDTRPTAPSSIARSHWAGVMQRLSRDPVAIVSGLLLLLIIGSALLAPWLGLDDPYKASMIRRLMPLGSEGHWLGTDELGRDMVARLIYGGRQSLLLGVMPVVFAFVIGTSVGLFAGYVGGWANMIIMRTLDIFYAFPSVLLAVAVAGALGPGMNNSLIALTLVFVPQVVRVAESVTTQVRKLDYIDAARMSGASALSIIRVQVLGNVIGPVFVYTTGLISVCMILGSGLSFLGLGVKPPEPEWGLMLNTLRSAIYRAPLVAALPGVMIFLTSIAFNLMADSVRSAMDVRR
jgi:peptide/nickel transport system permease protein